MQIFKASYKKMMIKPNFLINLNNNESSFLASKMKPKSLFHRNSYRVSNIKNEKGNETVIEKNNGSEYSNFQAFIEKMKVFYIFSSNKKIFHIQFSKFTN